MVGKMGMGGKIWMDRKSEWAEYSEWMENHNGQKTRMGGKGGIKSRKGGIGEKISQILDDTQVEIDLHISKLQDYGDTRPLIVPMTVIKILWYSQAPGSLVPTRENVNCPLILPAAN